MDDSARSTSLAAHVADARVAYDSCRHEDCLRALEGISPEVGCGWEEALIMRANALLALRRAPEAIAEIIAVQDCLEGAWLVRALTKLALAHGLSRNYQLARETIEQARALRSSDSSVIAEVGYAAGVIAWMEGDLARAEAALREAFADPSPARMARAHVQRSWLRAARGRYRDQLRDLLAALAYLECGPFNPYDTAHVVWTLAYLGYALFDRQAIDTITPYLERDFWTKELSEHRFHALRHVAWFHVLDGDELGGARLLNEAASAAPSEAFRVRAIVDRAMVAFYLREHTWSAEQLWEAHELAKRVDWEKCHGEEVLVLATMAELFAQVNPAEAAAYAARYEALVPSISPALSARSDAADIAVATFAHGMVHAALSAPVPAKRLLTDAWKAFEAIGFQWRAALTALALHDLTGDPKWLSCAADRAQIVPRSWIAREVERRRRASDGRPVRRLTPREREIFQALCSGLSNEEIAQRFYLHKQTVKKHVGNILDKHGVKSRAELFARMMGASR